jgi:hypothetical protein
MLAPEHYRKVDVRDYKASSSVIGAKAVTSMTLVQREKQALGGVDLVNRVLDCLVDGTVVGGEGILVVDLHGYDAWVPEAILRRSMQKTTPRFWCASVVHEAATQNFVKSKMGRLVFDMCRSGEMRLPGFPQFAEKLNELRAAESASQVSSLTYEVTTPMPDGCLVVLESLLDKWREDPELALVLDPILTDHNAEFNPHGHRSHSTTEEASPAKKPRTEEPPVLPAADFQTSADFKAAFPDMTSFKEGATEWCGSPGGGCVFFAGEQDVTLAADCERFSFGSGDWLEDADAADAMSDAEGRWLSFCLDLERSKVMLDPAQLPAHLSNVDWAKNRTMMSMGDLLGKLASAGDLTVKITNHTHDGDKPTLEQSKQTVFKLDDVSALGPE